MLNFLKKLLFTEKDSGGAIRAAVSSQYPAIKNEWFRISRGNYEKSMKDNPSKHLIGDEEKWNKMVEKQSEDFRYLNDASWIEFKKGYDFTEDEWKEIKNKLTSDLLNENKDPHYGLQIAGNILLEDKAHKQ